MTEFAHTAAATLTTSVSSLMLSSARPNASAAPGDSVNGENAGECKLLGPFAVLVQGALGALALLVLVFKRWRERPQRPVKVWAFDASKQVFGSVLLHIANLLMSMLSAGDLAATIVKAAADSVGADEKPNPCSFYLLNLAIDTTIGIPILYLILKVLSVGARHSPLANPPESIKSGYYGDPPRATWWLKQSLIYFVGLLLMKVCVFIIFQLCPWIVKVGDWALKWTEGNEALQIAFVMLIFPLIMNALQYYIIDTFIKNKNNPDEGAGDDQGSTRGENEEEGGLLAGDDPGHHRGIDDDEALKTPSGGKPLSAVHEVETYDPDKHGEDTYNSGKKSEELVTAGSSGSSTQNAEEEAIRNPPRI